jgi:NAD(P)H-hydrate epimerase
VLIAGPGLSQGAETTALIAQLITSTTSRLLIDADGLHALAQVRRSSEWKPHSNLILTPHPGEAAVLLETTVEEIQQDRLSAVRKLADLYQATVILKGAGSLVCKPEGTPWVNRTGNPGMASAGMGDLLAGIIGACWARLPDALSAACMGVWLHGTAGDIGVLKQGQASLTATTVAQNLPDAFQKLTSGTY